MTKKERLHRRAVANGETFVPSRKAPMPSPKTVPLKTRYKRVKKVVY